MAISATHQLCEKKEQVKCVMEVKQVHRERRKKEKGRMLKIMLPLIGNSDHKWHCL